MISKTTRLFRQALAQLPKDVRQQAKEAYTLFNQNPNHPGLRFKRVHTTEPIYSARINIDYRAIGVVDGEEIVWSYSNSCTTIMLCAVTASPVPAISTMRSPEWTSPARRAQSVT